MEIRQPSCDHEVMSLRTDGQHAKDGRGNMDGGWVLLSLVEHLSQYQESSTCRLPVM